MQRALGRLPQALEQVQERAQQAQARWRVRAQVPLAIF